MQLDYRNTMPSSNEADFQIQIKFYWTYSQKAKNQKAKQTIVHCTTKQYNTRHEMKCNAMQMQCDENNEPRKVL